MSYRSWNQIVCDTCRKCLGLSKDDVYDPKKIICVKCAKQENTFNEGSLVEF